jgi:hypothetical protein
MSTIETNSENSITEYPLHIMENICYKIVTKYIETYINKSPNDCKLHIKRNVNAYFKDNKSLPDTITIHKIKVHGIFAYLDDELILSIPIQSFNNKKLFECINSKLIVTYKVCPDTGELQSRPIPIIIKPLYKILCTTGEQKQYFSCTSSKYNVYMEFINLLYKTQAS